MENNQHTLSDLEKQKSKLENDLDLARLNYNHIRTEILKIDEKITQYRENVIDLRVGCEVKINFHHINIGTYQLRDEPTIEIIRVTDKFITAKAHSGSVYRTIGKSYRVNRSGEFRIGKKRFYELISRYSDLGKLVSRHNSIEELLK